MEKRPIKLVLKENTVSNKDTKDGEKQVFKSVLKGNIGEVEATLTLKSEKRDLLEEVTATKLREEMFIEVVDNPQTTFDQHTDPDPEGKHGTVESTPAKGQKKKLKPKKEGTEEHVVDAKFRLVEPKKIGPGADENILNEIA